MEDPPATPPQGSDYSGRVESIQKAARWAGWPLSEEQVEELIWLGSWLENEAIPAGGLGPNEADRIPSRHLADSLLFAVGWQRPSPPTALIDLGSGVGLPGIPLAVLWPETRVRLVDRSLRRADLARRAVRVLGRSNVEVIVDDAGNPGQERAEMVVSRALSGPEAVLEWAESLVTGDGVVVVGGSHRETPIPVRGERIVAVPGEILDRGVWLRIMAPR